ncbi:MAG TPA: hypothetical protein VJ697_12875 [Nitrososphaeraceae archaeon]|nr:hypothetical protein [Nitrososphaeraceae archaeon]
MTTDGEIPTYTGQDLGTTNKNGTDTYRGIIIFKPILMENLPSLII